MKKRYIIICTVSISICFILFIYNGVKHKKENKLIVKGNIQQGIMIEEQNNTATTELNKKENVNFKILDEKGNVKDYTFTYTFNGNKDDLFIISNILLDKYKEKEYKDIFDIPGKSRINKVSIYNETLYIDFNKEILQTKMQDILIEKKFIDNFVYNLISLSSNKNNFNDVLFTIDSQRVSTLFGNIDTFNPLRVTKY